VGGEATAFDRVAAVGADRELPIVSGACLEFCESRGVERGGQCPWPVDVGGREGDMEPPAGGDAGDRRRHRDAGFGVEVVERDADRVGRDEEPSRQGVDEQLRRGSRDDCHFVGVLDPGVLATPLKVRADGRRV